MDLNIPELCKKEKKSVTLKWKPYFPKEAIELEYSNDQPRCTFQIILDIINDYIKDNKIRSINNLKNILIEEYEKVADKLINVANILIFEGKTDYGRKLLTGEIKIEVMIMSEDYYLTNLDIHLLCKRFNLPIVLISSTKLLYNNQEILVLNRSDNDKYYFIKVASTKVNASSKYRLISMEKTLHIEKNKMAIPIQNNINKDIFILQDYIDNYKKEKKPVKLKITNVKEGGTNNIELPLIKIK